MRKSILALTVVLAMTLFSAGLASADTIMFPYVNSNPGNLSTIISVINEAAPTDICSTGDPLRLHYTYITKSVDAAHTDACDELDFDRPTTAYDIVTFDFGGNINDGLAMFNDATSYAGGVGAPNFDMPTLGTSEPRRGFILVNHRCLGGGDQPTSRHRTLDGEAMLFDVVNGAAWNYGALLSDMCDYDDCRLEPYGFTDRFEYAWAGMDGGTLDVYQENRNLWGPGGRLAKLPIMPPSDITTRMLVTPLMIASNVTSTWISGPDRGAGNTDMSAIDPSQQKRTRITFLGRGGGNGMTNRNEDAVSGGGPVHVRCVAGIDISEILGLAATTIQNEGGWAYVDLMDPTPLTGVDTAIYSDFDHSAIVFKLEFGAPTWSAGSMFNAARLLRTYRDFDAEN